MVDTTIVVIGGGIAGLSCIEGLIQDFDQTEPQFSHIILISESRIVKKIRNYESKGRSLETFEVGESSIDSLDLDIPSGLEFSYIVGTVTLIDSTQKIIYYNSDLKLNYDTLCICIGSKPRILDYQYRSHDPRIEERVIMIRDTTTVSDLKTKLCNCRRLAIIGNGGIGLELVSKISNCDKVWIIRDDSIGYTFFDSGCAKFMIESVKNSERSDIVVSPIQRHTYSSQARKLNPSGDLRLGPALGPDWTQNIELRGMNPSQNLEIIQQDELADLKFLTDGDYPLRLTTKKNKRVECDLVAVAIGVEPNNVAFAKNQPSMDIADGGMLVDNQMRTSLSYIYAAGDVVSCRDWPHNELWFQMRLWTQARQMGYYAGRCIASHKRNRDPSIYFNFECFTHCTYFFGLKLVLLGRYNGQQVQEGVEVIARVNPGKDYIKILVGGDGRIIGAVLAGDSGLEETIENLIHDRIDISKFKNELLDETIDIEDYFD